MTNWPICSMGAQVRFLSGGTPRKDEARFWNGEIPWVSSAEMVQRRIDETVLRVTEDGAKEGSRLIPKNTVLVVVRGMSLAKEFRVAITKKELTFNQDLKALLPSNNLNPVFLFYYLLSQSKAICDSASEAAHGTKKLDMPVLEQWPLPLPPKNTQKKIAAILSAYDDLIENNRRRIALLEKMAEEIYREWFVRMRFPGHENVKIVKGVPDGWQPTLIGNLLRRIPPGKLYEQKTASQTGKVPILDQGQSGVIGYHDNEPGVIASLENPIIVFANHTCYQRLIFFPFSVIQNVLPYIPSDTCKSHVLWLHYATYRVIEFSEYKGHWPEFVAKQVYYPGTYLTELFGSRVEPMLKQVFLLEKTIETLKSTRDMLLPRLISGKLSVENLDIRFPSSMEEMSDEV